MSERRRLDCNPEVVTRLTEALGRTLDKQRPVPLADEAIVACLDLAVRIVRGALHPEMSVAEACFEVSRIAGTIAKAEAKVQS